MKIKIIFLLIILTTIIYSCKTDFEINADYKDISLIYGLLNQKDTAHYLKINKAFLGTANAYSMASHSDSINYANAEVFLEEFENNNLKRTIILTKTNEFIKDSGTFATDNNYMYKTKAILDSLNIYKLNIKIGSKHITSETKLIHDLRIVRPVVNTNASVNFTNYTNSYKLEWISAINGKIYEIVLRLHYIERNSLTGDTASYYIDWKQPSAISMFTTGGDEMRLEINCESFYQFVKAVIKPKPGYARIVKKTSLDFIFSVGSDDLNTYIEVSKPSEGLVQDKPAFTNIENGIGIFSSRYFKYINLPLYNKTIDSLAHGIYTKDLGFWDYDQTRVSTYWATK